MAINKAIDACKRLLARLSPGRGIAWLLRLCILALLSMLFLHILNVSNETVVSWCESIRGIYVFGAGFFV